MEKKKKLKAVMMVLMLLSLYYAYQGVSMHKQVAVEEAKFHRLQQEYFSLAKVRRDAAPANSELNKKLVRIQQYPSKLLELKLVGVGKLLTGIYILLLGILIALMVMPVRLGKIIMEKPVE